MWPLDPATVRVKIRCCMIMASIRMSRFQPDDRLQEALVFEQVMLDGVEGSCAASRPPCALPRNTAAPEAPVGDRISPIAATATWKSVMSLPSVSRLGRFATCPSARAATRCGRPNIEWEPVSLMGSEIVIDGAA